MPDLYLVDTSEREHEACRRLVQMPPLSERMFQSLGVPPSFSWFILRLKMDRLVERMHGDIDILAGPLNWTDTRDFTALVDQERAEHADWHLSWNCELAARKLALQGGIQWPPFFGHLIGVEAKCSYLPRNVGKVTASGLKSTKSQLRQTQKIRNEVDKLFELGLDHVLLLDIIANPPVSGPDGAWMMSLSLADSSSQAISCVLKQRLPDDSEAAHWVWSLGSVSGGDESRRGAGAPVALRTSRGNLRLAMSITIQAQRKDMEERLGAVLSMFDRPTVFPAVFLDCQRCRKIHSVPCDDTGCMNG